MARRVTCGFELNDVLKEAGCDPSSTSGAYSVVSTTKHSGTYGLRINPTNEISVVSWMGNLVVRSDWWFRFYLYIATAPSAITTIARTDQSVWSHVKLGADRTLSLWAESPLTQIGSASAALTVGQWYRVEMEIEGSPAAGSRIAGLYLDEVEVARATNLTVVDGVQRLQIGANLIAEGASCDLFYDDVAMNDDGGTTQNASPGAGSVIYLRPNGAGDADVGTPLRGGADSGSDHGQMNEITPNDATNYMNLDTNPCDVWVDAENSPAAISTGDTIKLVEVNGRVAGASGSAANWFPQIKSQASGTIVSATAVALASASWFTNDDTTFGNQVKLVQYVDPQAGGAWTKALLDTMQISAKTTDGNPDTFVTAIWAVVEFQPAGGAEFMLGGGVLAQAAMPAGGDLSIGVF